jgi:hypothetical protein
MCDRVASRLVASSCERHCRKEASASGSPGPAAIGAAITPFYTTSIDCSSATDSCILGRQARIGVAVSVTLCDCPGANLGCPLSATRQLR